MVYPSFGASCLEEELVEAVKWRDPFFVHAGRSIAIIGAFRSDFRLSFFNAALMKGPEGVLEKQGPNTAHPDMIRFTEEERVGRMAPVIRTYLRQAVAYADAGIKPPKEDGQFELRVGLREALSS